MASSSAEKTAYWEERLHEALLPISVEELVILNWSIEAFRRGRIKEARSLTAIPGELQDHMIGRRLFIPPWNLSGILNEKLAIGGQASKQLGRKLNLKNWNGIARLCNLYNGLANIESTMDFGSNEILAAMPRLLWPQYDWQLGYENAFRISRAWNTYATPTAKRFYEEMYGMSLEKFLKVAVGVYTGSQERPCTSPPNPLYAR